MTSFFPPVELTTRGVIFGNYRIMPHIMCMTTMWFNCCRWIASAFSTSNYIRQLLVMIITTFPTFFSHFLLSHIIFLRNLSSFPVPPQHGQCCTNPVCLFRCVPVPPQHLHLLDLGIGSPYFTAAIFIPPPVA